MSNKELDKAKAAAEETAEKAADAVKEKAPKAKKNLKRFKYGSMSVVIVALVLAIVVAVNIMASMLAKRSPLRH